MSYVERTAKKLLPILMEVKKRMIPDKKREDKSKMEAGSDESDDEILVDLKLKGK